MSKQNPKTFQQQTPKEKPSTTHSPSPKTFNTPIENSNWSLLENNIPLPPLKFSNGKNQEDIVKEITNLIKEGNKVILLRGVCGTGKSAIALNIARKLGRTSIVVPVKALQKQYELDYTNKKYLLKPNGQKLKITLITGRDNHDSLIKQGASCADPSLPENIKITEKNYKKLTEYYKDNPLITHKIEPDPSKLRRMSVAPTNPYWSPILPEHLDVYLPDAEKKEYMGLNKKKFVFHHRKKGCSYYDQYQSYIDSDVIIFNAAKYKIDTDSDKKPATEIEIIDEADEFLDNFSTQQTLNLTRLANSLTTIHPKTFDTKNTIKFILKQIKFEEINKRALGIDEDQIFPLKETPIYKIFQIILKNPDVEDEIIEDESNYANRLLEAVRNFKDFSNETFITYRKNDDELHASLVTTNLSKKFQEMINKNKALVLMSGTLHTEKILKEVFGIEKFKIVEAETKFPGTIEIIRTGKEFDCRYAKLKLMESPREKYLLALSDALKKAQNPTLIHVNAFQDLPTSEEIQKLGISNLIAKEKLRNLQEQDKNGNAIEIFKSGLNSVLFTTKCSRGADFPDDTCRSIIFTKYPNPNPKEPFWKILKQNLPEHFWEFYTNKAQREFQQKIWRGLRSQDDHINILSPDSRVLDAVRELQLSMIKNNSLH